MNKASWIRVSGLFCVLAVVAFGCGGGEESGAGGREGEFQVVRDQQASLDAKRLEVADLKAQIAAAGAMESEVAEAEEGAPEEGTGEEGEEAMAASGDDLEAQLDQAQNDLEDQSEAFMAALIGFLNTADMVQGEAPTGVNLEAIRLKSSEDLIIAEEYVRKGGDYRRALEIIDTSLILDPAGPELVAAREKYDADQYMTEERLAVVTKGMTEVEVRDLLGTANPHNVREFEEDNVTAWYYRRADKGAAGVFFQEKDGAMLVYKIDVDAVKVEEEAEEGAE